MSRRFLSIVLFCLLLGSAQGQSEGFKRDTAWEVMLSQSPEVVDDPNIGWMDRLVLHVLTPAQARDYYQGADPESLTLEDGTTLAEYLAARLSPPGNVYVPLPTPCRLFEVSIPNTEENLILQAKGNDLSAQGGSLTGCAIPEQTVAVVLQIQAASTDGLMPRLKLWATDAPEPVETFLDEDLGASSGYKTMAMVPLCVAERCEGDLQMRGTEVSQISGEAVGYFRALMATDQPGGLGGVSFYTEGSSNNFFGTGAGASNTTGSQNTFVGGNAGNANTEGSTNSFFGYEAGNTNTTGYANAFFGLEAGFSNTTGHDNAFFGESAGWSNTSGTDNSFFGQNAGLGNTIGSQNSFFGQEAGTNATGSYNAFFGYQSGYGATSGEDNTGTYNSFYGKRSGYSNTTGSNNSFFGEGAGRSNTTGEDNAFFGSVAGYSNTTGDYNSFFGEGSGNSNVDGQYNAFYGYRAGQGNLGTDGDCTDPECGSYNSFFGSESGYFNTIGSYNAFFGAESGTANTDGDGNTAVGAQALLSNIYGSANTAVGAAALHANIAAEGNTAVGLNALGNTESGDYNTGVGYKALDYNETGESNTAVGGLALTNNTASGNTAVGGNAFSSNTTGTRNTAVGYEAGNLNVDGSRNTFVGDWAGTSNVGTDGVCTQPDCGSKNSFFGSGSGNSNTTGAYNSFLGSASGGNNTTGSENSCFGTGAGWLNEEGELNSFFGRRAGDSNTVEDGNTLMGAYTDLDPGPEPGTSPVTNATAIGQRAYVSQSNSLVLGSIAGVNDATDDVKVGIGTTAPNQALHVARSDGTAQILVEDTGTEPTLTTLHMKNNGRVQAVYENTDTGATWQLSQHLTGFIVSLVGTGGSEFRVLNDGSVQMGPGADITFDLDTLGNLTIGGFLTQLSDRSAKENFMPLDSQQVLEKVSQLPLSEWNFKQEEASVRHIGPMAQDFREAFGLGKDERHISSMDTSGVALAAIQGLNEKMEEKDAEIQSLRTELAEIKAMLANR